MAAERQAFDTVRYKQATREQWETAAAAWHRWSSLLSAWLGPATEIMLDMAEIAPGGRVLDVAAGAGEQTGAVARRIGPHGYILATDISPTILTFAAAMAQQAGYRNVETRELDGENLMALAPESFDAVLSRVGLIYFPDQQKALPGMKHTLKPGGKVAAIVYSPAENNGFFSVPVSIIRRKANLPPRSLANRVHLASAGMEYWQMLSGRLRLQRTSASRLLQHLCDSPRRRSVYALKENPLGHCTKCLRVSPLCSSRKRGRKSSMPSANRERWCLRGSM